jgi:two-component system chemotaxis response regulator CheY
MHSSLAERPSASYRPSSPPYAVAAPLESGGPAPRGRASRPILVVDDDPSIRALVVEVLTDDGYAVVEAGDGAEALALTGAAEPCLILLDMRMPVMDGWAFARAYREQTTDRAPVVVMTAARDARAWAAEIGADGVLPKPFDLVDLANVVGRFC